MSSLLSDDQLFLGGFLTPHEHHDPYIRESLRSTVWCRYGIPSENMECLPDVAADVSAIGIRTPKRLGRPATHPCTQLRRAAFFLVLAVLFLIGVKTDG
jgi:hypothetical protein